MGAENSEADVPLKLLSLDGGGIRGISTLIILKYLMKRINPKNPPKPCDYFDLIGGTSTGGIIAIMLGRLQMDVQTCIDKYIELSTTAFAPKRSKGNVLFKLKDKWEVNGAYRADGLAREMRQAVQDNVENKDPEAKLFDPNPACKVFVCAFTKARNTPVLLRSYTTPDSVDSLSGSDCTIWQAARATSAAATFFDAIKIGRQTFVDGATGMNNPVEQVLEEAKSIWPDAIQNGRIQCLVSIGTGVPDLKSFGDNLKQVVETLKSISTETERTEERFYKNHGFLGIDERYFRFNVDKGLADVELDDHKRVDEIEASAEEYLRAPRVNKLIGTFLAAKAPVVSLLERHMKDRCLSWLKTVDPLAQRKDARKYRAPDSTTGQWFLKNPFEQWKTNAKSFMWLTGKPGSGKTVLSTATIDKLETEHDGIVIYFYFSFREEATQNVTNFKHSLLMQLVRQLVREDETRRDYFYVPKVFQKLFDKYSHSQDPLDEHVDATMEGLLNESKHTYIIVDALDEFLNQTPLTTGNRGKVIKFLEGLCRTSHGGTHILVTSRRENDIETAVKEIEVPKNIVLMDTKEINIDIKTFLMISLREHPYKEWTGKLKKLVAKTLTSKADGVFRWAALQLLGLRDKDRERDVETALQDLPEDLEETYKVMLTRIENSKRSDMALSILRWLAYSQRSILLSEMSEIAIFEMEACVSADVDDYTVSYHPKDRFSSIWMTRKILSGLVTVSGVDDRDEVPQDQDGTVSFSHFTVQEYLQGKNVSPTKFRLEESTGHWYIMRSCLGYIKSYDEVYGESRTQQQADKGNKVGSTQEALDSNHDSDADSEFDFSDSETPETGIIDYRPFPLLLYAAKYWWLHAVAFCNSGGVTSVSDRVGKVATAIDELQGQAFKSTAKVALAVASSDSDSEKEDSTSNRIWFPMRQPATDKVSFEIKDSDRGEATFLLVDCLDTYLSKCESWKTQKVNAFDFESPLALRHMSGVGDGTIVQLLLDAGVDVSYKTSDGEAALHRAVRKNHKRIVEQLVERKAKLNPTDGERRTPLSWAAGDGLTDIAAYLIDKGARIDPDDADKSHLGGKAPEVRSAIRPFAVLSNIYVWVADRPGKGWTALHWALHNEQQETAILLVEQGADILDTDWWGPCPLSIAIVKRQRAVLRAMILKDKEACKMGTFGNQWTALHLAAAYRDLPVMQLLLPEAADVTLRDKSGCTAMEIAAVGAHALGMETMLQGRHSQFWNPEMGRAEDAIKLLLSHGGSVDPGGELCSTPLHYASMHGQLEAAETLLECGVSVHVRNKFDWTPLLNAAVYGHTPVARLLLSKGAEVNATTDKGLSALILASANGHVETVRLLLEDGADTSLREQNGKTALEVAKQLEKDDVVRLLSSSGSDVVPSLESDLEVENKEPNSDNSVDDFAQ